jgi:hypothetical protein
MAGDFVDRRRKRRGRSKKGASEQGFEGAAAGKVLNNIPLPWAVGSKLWFRSNRTLPREFLSSANNHFFEMLSTKRTLQHSQTISLTCLDDFFELLVFGKFPKLYGPARKHDFFAINFTLYTTSFILFFPVDFLAYV